MLIGKSMPDFRHLSVSGVNPFRILMDFRESTVGSFASGEFSELKNTLLGSMPDFRHLPVGKVDKVGDSLYLHYNQIHDLHTSGEFNKAH